jgi:hypothetical protein
MMSINKFIALVAAGVLVAGTAGACGESLFRVGKGVPFRQYTAPLPGHIVAVATTNGELAMLESLAAAGHSVRVVASADEISTVLTGYDADIVLAYYSEREKVAAETAGRSVIFIPVARKGTSETSLAAAAYDYSLVSDDSVKTFLRTIHRSLKARG